MLMEGLNTISNTLITKKKIQKKKEDQPYWNINLQQSLDNVNSQLEVAKTTNSNEDYRYAKNLKNKHSKLIKKTIKNHKITKLNRHKSRWKRILKMEDEEDLNPVESEVENEFTTLTTMNNFIELI